MGGQYFENLSGEVFYERQLDFRIREIADIDVIDEGIDKAVALGTRIKHYTVEGNDIGQSLQSLEDLYLPSNLGVTD